MASLVSQEKKLTGWLMSGERERKRDHEILFWMNSEDGEEEEEENGEDIEEKPEKEEVKDSLKEESSATGFLPPPPPSQSFQPSTFEPRLPPPRKLPASSSSDSSSDGGERRRPNLSEQIKVSYQERFSDIIRSFIGGLTVEGLLIIMVVQFNSSSDASTS